jgi:hypothetical protein
VQFILLIGLSVPAIVHIVPPDTSMCYVSELMEKILAKNKSPILQNVRGNNPRRAC